MNIAYARRIIKLRDGQWAIRKELSAIVKDFRYDCELELFRDAELYIQAYEEGTKKNEE